MSGRGTSTRWGGDSGSVLESFGRLKAEYDASRPSRFRRRRRGEGVTGKPGDYHVRSEARLLYMVELARELDRNDPIVGQAINRVVDNVVQGGFKFDPQTGSEAVDRLLKRRFKSIHANPERIDAAGERTFAEIEWLIARSAMVDGDHWPVLDPSGVVEMNEFHRVRTPTWSKRNIVHGVELNERRRKLRAWFTRDDVDPFGVTLRVNDFAPKDIRDEAGERVVLQVLLDDRRVSQTRGVTAMAPIADMTGIHSDAQFAELVKIQMAACVVFFREQPAGPGFKVGASQEGERQEEARADGSTRLIEKIAPGMDITGRPGEKFNGFAPGIPTPEWSQYTMLILSIIAVNLNMPVQVLLLDPTKTNFSGWRGAIDQARQTWRRMQAKLIARFHNPYTRWRLRHLMASDSEVREAALEAEGGVEAFDLFRFQWRPPKWGYIQPVEDTTANHLRVRTGQTSPRRLIGETYGDDFGEVMRESVDDYAQAVMYAMASARAINETTLGDPDAGAGELGLAKPLHGGEPVSWRELLPMIHSDRLSFGFQLPGGGSGEAKREPAAAGEGGDDE